MNKKKIEVYERLLSTISTDFDRRVLDDPDFASEMPIGAYVLFQVQYDGLSGPSAKDIRAYFEEFNAWLKDLVERQRDPDQSVYNAILVVHYNPSSPPQAWRHPERFPRDFQFQRAYAEV
ncbi:hypothetical protein HYR54_15645 [Candidatus Acetothermia bacterium]|nr:hypothetical protein [Candidatus Acetothermia bacterium]